jgi:adenylylsulfate kinase
MKILIMGLPGAGKTNLANHLTRQLTNKTVEWYNADLVREKFNDWDFSESGRIRQAERMKDLAENSNTDFVICDFVAPLKVMRDIFDADWTIWVDTISESRYENTNAVFEEPSHYDFRVTEQDAEKWAPFIAKHLLENQRRPIFDYRKETVQMLGRWQPWHTGHRALFERLLQKTGQVIIQIRDVQGWQDSNPFGLAEVKQRIRRDLDMLYQGQYDIQVVPNIVHIGWGRGVGYTFGEEEFDKEITDVSGTQIRKSMGLS